MPVLSMVEGKGRHARKAVDPLLFPSSLALGEGEVVIWLI
jgi:hypothetical protein